MPPNGTFQSRSQKANRVRLVSSNPCTAILFFCKLFCNPGNRIKFCRRHTYLQHLLLSCKSPAFLPTGFNLYISFQSHICASLTHSLYHCRRSRRAFNVDALLHCTPSALRDSFLIARPAAQALFLFASSKALWEYRPIQTYLCQILPFFRCCQSLAPVPVLSHSRIASIFASNFAFGTASTKVTSGVVGREIMRFLFLHLFILQIW